MLFAAAWFWYLGYGPTLDPTHIAWMYRDDWAANLWGFLFFRNAPWSFPLGALPNLFYPFGTSIGFTDANPWMSVLFRSVSWLLPRDFQFAGLWFLLCFLLQALFGVRIARVWTNDRVQAALGGALFAVTPILPVRASHVALCAIFFVSAGIWLNVAPIDGRETARRQVFVSLALCAWAAGTHGYLSVMLLILCCASYVRQWLVQRVLSAREALGAAVLALAVTISVYLLFGYIGWKTTDLTAEGFGEFSEDLVALVNSQHWSRFVPALPHQPRQWEGFAYLGTGVLGLLALSTSLALLRPAHVARALKSQWPLVTVVLMMQLYALSSSVTFLGEPLLDLSFLYQHLTKVTGVFRSSGRFVWPLHLLLVSFVLYSLARLRQRHIVRGLLALGLTVQVVELKTGPLDFRAAPRFASYAPVWSTVGADYRHLELVPLQLQWACAYNDVLVNRLAYLAYREKLTFNSGNFMRREPGANALCDRHIEALDAYTVYVVDARYLRDFVGKRSVCGLLDGVVVCADAARETALTRALQANRLL